jgi:hypothetical protein
MSIRDPEQLCKRYAQLYIDAYGEVVRAAVQS